MIRKGRFNSLIVVNWNIRCLTLSMRDPAALGWSSRATQPAHPRQSLEAPPEEQGNVLQSAEVCHSVHGVYLSQETLLDRSLQLLLRKGKMWHQNEVAHKSHLGSQSLISTTTLLQRYFKADQHQKYNHIIWSSSESMCPLKSCYWFNELLQLFSITRN